MKSNVSARGVAEGFLRRREASILVVAVALVLYFQWNRSIFLSRGNMVTVSQYLAAPAIVAVGEVLLLVSGEIDLSVGNVFTFAPFLMHFGVEDYNLPVVVAILVALVISAGIGFINGFITVVLRVPSFVTTLGMLFALNGLTLKTSNGAPAEIPAKAEGLGHWLGKSDWSELIWAVLIVAIFHVVLTRTPWGLHTVAVGGNLVGASEAGIRAGRIKIGNFMITSVLGAFAGILEAFRTHSIDTNAGGDHLMFLAVAAAVIGGTALAGGSGTIIGALLGAAVLGILNDGFNLIGYSAYEFDLVLGLAILAAMIANVYLTRLRRAGRT
jgi:simple sugar transport system permease protein